MRYQFSLNANLLLVNETSDTVELEYLNYLWKMPMIGPRPPYYINPRYELNYPII